MAHGGFNLEHQSATAALAATTPSVATNQTTVQLDQGRPLYREGPDGAKGLRRLGFACQRFIWRETIATPTLLFAATVQWEQQCLRYDFPMVYDDIYNRKSSKA